MYTMQRFLVVMIGAALASAAGAQSLPYQGPPGDTSYAPANAGQAQVDPPARVARLGYLSGNVSFTPAGENDWVQAQVNRPVVTGDKLWTDAGGRAELQIGAATVRLDQSSSFDVLNLDDQLAQMELTQGALNLDVSRLRGNEAYEIDTPTIAFVANRVGDYRIDVNPAGYTVVTARRGGGDAIGEAGKRIRIEEGQSVRFNNSQLNVNDYQVSQIGAPDAFDSFATERVQRYAQAAPARYVSEDVVGYQDLDQYGTWDDAPQYGHVWYPNEVAAGWAPYHDGNWAWVDPWGWTWVDNSPWGYAPFHYGRWAYIGSRWGWVPGPVDVAPVYAPALVAFVGGGGFSVGISIGGPIGWFALGPSDVYFPGYHCGRDYFARVNYGNSVYINHTVVNNYYGNWSSGRLDYAQINYTNRTAPGALVAMSGSAFVAGRSVRSSAVAVNGTTFANARVLPRATLAPTRESLVAGRGRAAAPPTTALNRPVIAANRPAAARPSFAQRQSLLQKSAGEPLTTAQMHTLAAHPGNTRTAAAVNNNVRVVGNRGQEVAARSTTARSDRASEVAKANAASPSRAPEMNRSPAKANAQYLRSAGFAHQGVVPGSERSTTAEAARAGAKTQSRASAQADSRAVQESANRNTQQQVSSANRAGGNRNNGNDAVRTQGHLNSSSYAHTQNSRGATNANARDSEMQRRAATAESTARGGSGNSMQERGSTGRTTPGNSARAVTQRSAPPTESRARSSSTVSPQTARTDANSRSSAQEHSRSSSSNTARNYRAPEQQRSSTSTSSIAQHAATPQQNRAPAHVESGRENRSAVSQRTAPVQQRAEPVQRSAPVQRSEPPQVAHSAAPQPQARSQGQPRQVARQAPQKQPPAKDKKNEKDGGG